MYVLMYLLVIQSLDTFDRRTHVSVLRSIPDAWANPHIRGFSDEWKCNNKLTTCIEKTFICIILENECEAASSA